MRKWIIIALTTFILLSITLTVIQGDLTKIILEKEELTGKYAVIVGIKLGDFDSFTNETFAFYDYLLSAGFTPQNITLLINENATIENVTKSLKSLPEGESVSIVFWFNGHGGLELSDNGLESVISLYDGTINCSELKKILENKRSKKMLLVFDCCYAGIFEEYLGGLGRIVITSTNNLEKGITLSDIYHFNQTVSKSNQKGFSPFGYFFIESLNNGRSIQGAFLNASRDERYQLIGMLLKFSSQYPVGMYLNTASYYYYTSSDNPNQPPIALFEVKKIEEGKKGPFTYHILELNGSSSYDPDGTLIYYEWGKYRKEYRNGYPITSIHYIKVGRINEIESLSSLIINGSDFLNDPYTYIYPYGEYSFHEGDACINIMLKVEDGSGVTNSTMKEICIGRLEEEKQPSPSLTPVSPGFEFFFAIAGLLAVAYLLRRRR